MANGWDPNITSCCLGAAAKEMTMPKMTAKNRARTAAVKAKATHARILQARRTKTPEITDKILKQLASLNLPPNPWVYSVVLAALEREANG